MIEHAVTIANLRHYGVAKLGRVPWIDEFTAYLGSCPRYPGHVRARQPKPGITCHAPEDVIAAPHLLDYAKSLTPIVEEYFGGRAHLWSLNAFYTAPDAGYWRGLHGLHSDVSTSGNAVGDKPLALFILGYDTPISGAQLHVRPDGLIQPLYGPKGTAWLADQTHLHAGLIPEKPRLLIWARWAEKIPQAFYDENLPVIK